MARHTAEDLYDDDSGELLLSKAQVEATSIDELDLDREFSEAAGNLAYWNAKYTAANREFLVARHNSRITEARLRMLMKEEHKDDKPKATVDDITSYIHTHEDYETDHMAYVEAEAEAEKMKKFAEAVKAKLDMLRSVGAKLRAEWEGDPTTKRYHRDNRDDRARDQ